MKDQEFDRILQMTFEDQRLSRAEERALKQILENADEDDMARLRNRAFDFARQTFAKVPDTTSGLNWLEALIKVLARPQVDYGHDAKAFFSPGTECRDRIVKAIRTTRSHMDICVFTITDNDISDHITRAHAKGRKVRIITDDMKSMDRGSDIERMIDAGIEVRFDKSRHHMHHKFALFDDAILLTGSYNWTRSAAKHNQENIIATDERRMVKAFQQQFETLWEAMSS